VGGSATIVRLWVVETGFVKVLFEGFQGLLLGCSEVAEVAREQLRIIGSVDIWLLELRHVLPQGQTIRSLPKRSRRFDHPSLHVPLALFTPDFRQEPLDNSLSFAEIQQRYSFVREMRLILYAKSCKQIKAERQHLAHRTLAEREMQGMTAKLFFKVRN